jgi:hypothetical protein
MLDVKGLGFGSEYRGRHQVWTFQFRPDRPDTFADESEAVALLEKDLDKIPMILNLTETINTQRAVLDTSDRSFANTVVKAI